MERLKAELFQLKAKNKLLCKALEDSKRLREALVLAREDLVYAGVMVRIKIDNALKGRGKK